MEFLDESESRPRFLFQSKQLAHNSDPDQSLDSSSYLFSLHKPTLLICLSFSILVLFIAFFYFNDIEPFKSLLLWLSLSFFLGPFAPPSLTAGDIRVGLGPPIKEMPEIDSSNETKEKFNRKSIKKLPNQVNSSEDVRFDGVVEKSKSKSIIDSGKNVGSKVNGEEEKYDGESEWNDVDEEILRKLLVKHPVGKPGRWEAIAEGFKGKYKVESVIGKAKELGKKKVSDQDSYNKFLKDRKPVDQRVVDEVVEETNANGNVEEGKKERGWSAADDLALLNALKTFPKDVAMRWEKIAAAVPGKTKAACMKRVTELKKGFRSSKGSSGQPS